MLTYQYDTSEANNLIRDEILYKNNSKHSVFLVHLFIDTQIVIRFDYIKIDKKSYLNNTNCQSILSGTQLILPSTIASATTPDGKYFFFSEGQF